MRYTFSYLVLLTILSGLLYGYIPSKMLKTGQIEAAEFTTWEASPMDIKMYWKHNGHLVKTFTRLKSIEPGLVFAMNGGMFDPNFAPVGLYVENGTKLKSITRSHNPDYNYGIQPQGIFLIRDSVPADAIVGAKGGNKAVVKGSQAEAEVTTIDNYNPNHVRYATESAPMLIIQAKINPNLPKSMSSTIRNGVGILPDGKVLMAVSKDGVTFQEFASYFLHKGCINALYLDGGISGAYTGPNESNGEFGVIIGVLNSKVR
jgi:uncharacterized protein YigE (DUF2233 family)